MTDPNPPAFDATVDNVQAWLAGAARVLGCRVELRCECPNLETVYVRVLDAGKLVVTDDGETFAYLEQGEDPAFERIADAAAADICARHRVSLIAGNDEVHTRIELRLATGDPLAAAVCDVAETIDAIFSAALRTHLE